MLNNTPMYYIELTVRAESTGSGLVMLQDLIKKPLVRCDDEATAKQVCFEKPWLIVSQLNTSCIRFMIKAVFCTR